MSINRSWRHWALAAGAAVILPAAGLASPASADPNTNNAGKLVDAVTLDGVLRHERVLQSIADANGGTRFASGPGHAASARYVADQLTAAGYQVTLQEFPFIFTQERRETLRELSPTARTLAVDVMQYSPATPAGGLTAQIAVVPVDADTGCTAADFAGGSYTGTIALILRGGCTFAIKAANAAAAGAAAVIVQNNDTANPDDLVNGTLGAPADARVPTAGVSYNTGLALATEAAAGPVTVLLDLEEFREPRTSVNVIAETRDGRDDNVVMLGSHLDSVVEGPGINDNGSGSSALLELALRFAKTKPNNTVRFAWWSAEEFGLVGSTYYVNSLSQARRDAIALYLNFDMIASPNHVFGVYDGDDSDHVGSGPGPAGSAQIERAFTDYFASRGVPSQGADFTGRSDYGPFIAVGIPAGGLFTGAEVRKTAAEAALYGGTAGVAYDPCYHQACDTYANLNPYALDVNSDAIATVLARYAFDTSDINGVRTPGKSHGATFHDEVDA
jgi:Zn-dependent M28 family amino/carboxypeptidase